MGNNVAQWSLIISITSACIAVSSVLASWAWGSRSTQLRKWARALVLTKTSDARAAALEAELAELHSTLQKLTTTVTRLSSRHGMRELRERRSSEPAREGPPPPGDKRAARAFYLHGKSHAEIARLYKQRDIEDEDEDEDTNNTPRSN